MIAGLKAVAVAVVAHALLGMAKNLASDRERATIAVGAMVFVLLVPGAFGRSARSLRPASSAFCGCVRRSTTPMPTFPYPSGPRSASRVSFCSSRYLRQCRCS